MNREIQLHQPGQLFVHDPIAFPAPPIAVAVEAPNGAAEDATVGTPSIDGFASELVEGSACGAPWLTLADANGLAIGRRYLVGTPPHHEWVTVTAIDGPRVSMRRRLAHAFAAGTMMRGCQLSVGVNPIWQQAQARRIELGGIGLGAYSVRWQYQIDGVTSQSVDRVDLVFVPRAAVVTADDIEQRYPGWIDTLPSEHAPNRGTDVILEAHDLVRRDAARADVELNNAVETRELVELRARMVTLEQEVLYGQRSPAELDVVETRYQRRAAELWSKLRRGAPIPLAVTKPKRTYTVLDDLHRWLDARRVEGVSQYKQLRLLREVWLPKLETPRECWEAARLIREYITSRALVLAREALLRELE